MGAGQFHSRCGNDPGECSYTKMWLRLDIGQRFSLLYFSDYEFLHFNRKCSFGVVTSLEAGGSRNRRLIADRGKTYLFCKTS